MPIDGQISKSKFRKRGIAATLLCSAALSLVIAGPALSDDGTLRLLSLNIWNQFKQTPTVTRDFMVNGNWDLLMFQEANGSKYVSDIPGMLQSAGLGTYKGSLVGDVGIVSRLPGTIGSYTAPGIGTQGRFVNFQTVTGEAGRPTTTIGTVHLDYSDEVTARVAEAKALNAWAASTGGPLIVAGDFNAGDVSERGLHSQAQQELLLRIYTKSPNNSFYYGLLQQYATDKTALDKFITDWRGKGSAAIDAAAIPSSLFTDETYPVAGNTPQTMNVLKKQFMLLQTEREREQFAPHALNDGSGTWPSAGEDDTNTWGSWHRVKIDHFLASRPFGKWYAITDDPSDPYLGVIKDVYVTKPDGSTAPLSDHEPVAHEFTWIGPSLQTYKETVAGADVNKTRLVWGKDTTTFADSKEFYLTRNNMRQDVYLGQVSDADGKPILTGLTDAEKKTLLDCKSNDPRFAKAIVEYCIDDHSFIGETLITDAGTVIVDEDAALGSSAAKLRLDNGSLRIAGTGMQKLDRSVVLEAGGGTLDIADAANSVVVDRAISGIGGLTKAGAGTLDLVAANTYTGDTVVKGGRLAVNGSIASSGKTTVYAGGIIGGNGTVGSLAIADGGTLAPGNSIGTLNVNGNLDLAKGSTYQVEVDDTGKTDHVIVSGKTTIAGGTVMNIAAGAAYKPLTDYSIISSAGGIEGSFDSIVSNFAFLDPSLIYGGDQLTMRLERNDTAFDGVAGTFNQRSAAIGADSLGFGSPLYDALVSLDADTARSAFAQIGGEIHASTYGALLENSQTVRQGAYDRLRSGAAGPVGQNATELSLDETGMRTGAADTFGIWSKSYGTWAERRGDGNAYGIDQSAGGVMVGIDGMIGDDWRVGLLGGYGHTSVSTDGLAAKSDTDQIDIGIYAGTHLGPVGLRFGAAHSWNNIDSERSVFIPALNEQLTAGYDASTSQVFGEISYQQKIGQTVLEPFANLAYVHLKNDGFSENGGAAALSVKGGSQGAVFAEFGLRAATEFSLKDTRGTLHGSASWRHANGDTTPQTNMAFSGGSTFTTRGTPIADDVAVLNAGVNFALGSNATIDVSYSGQFGSGVSQNGINGYLGVKF